MVGEPACPERWELWWWWLAELRPLAASSASNAWLLGLPSSLGEGLRLARATGKRFALQCVVSSTGNLPTNRNCYECTVLPGRLKILRRGKRSCDAPHKGSRSRLLLGAVSLLTPTLGDSMNGQTPQLHHPFPMALGVRCLCLCSLRSGLSAVLKSRATGQRHTA